MIRLRWIVLLCTSLGLVACNTETAPLTGEDVQLPADMEHHLLIPEAVMMLEEPTVFLEDFLPFDPAFVAEAGISRIRIARYAGKGIGLDAKLSDRKPVATYSLFYNAKGQLEGYEPFETRGLGRNQEAIQRNLKVRFTYGTDGKLKEELQEGEATGRSWMLKRTWIYKKGKLSRVNEKTQTELGNSAAVTYYR